MTYRHLDRTVRETADGLSPAGVAGDCVGLRCLSGTQYIVLNYAVWRCGACVVPVATELASREKQEISREMALDYLISQSGMADFAAPLRRALSSEIRRNAAVSAIRGPRPRRAGFDRIEAADYAHFRHRGRLEGRGAVAQTVRDRIEAANEALRIGPDDHVLWLLPMAYHFTVSIVSYLTLGAAILFPANHFAAAVTAATQRHRATIMYASPSHWACWPTTAQRARRAACGWPSQPPVHWIAASPAASTSATGGRSAQALGIIGIGLHVSMSTLPATRPFR